MEDPRHDSPVVTAGDAATTGRQVARALCVLAVIGATLATSLLAAVLLAALCGLTIAAARSGGAA